jgi:hypothetical protein
MIRHGVTLSKSGASSQPFTSLTEGACEASRNIARNDPGSRFPMLLALKAFSRRESAVAKCFVMVSDAKQNAHVVMLAASR